MLSLQSVILLGFLVLIIALYLQNPIHEMKASIFPKRAEMLDRRRRSLNSGGQQIPYPTGLLKGIGSIRGLGFRV